VSGLKGKYISLSTYRRSGVSVETPVWFVEMEQKLYVFSARDSGKVKRLRNSSKARIALCDARGGLKGEWQDAEARVVEDRATIERAHDLLRTKYGFQMWLADVMSKLSGRLNRRAFIEIDPL
jgi:hypothetical protein